MLGNVKVYQAYDFENCLKVVFIIDFVFFADKLLFLVCVLDVNLVQQTTVWCNIGFRADVL